MSKNNISIAFYFRMELAWKPNGKQHEGAKNGSVCNIFFYLNFNGCMLYFNICSSQTRMYYVQVGQYISKIIGPAISDENQVKNLAVQFLNSSAKISEQKMRFFLLQSIAITCTHSSCLYFPRFLFSFCLPCIFVFAESAIYPKCKHIFEFLLWYLPFFCYKPYKVSCIFWIWIIMKIGSSKW